MQTDLWNIKMLGRLTAQRGERTVTKFRTEKTGLLLACLAQDPRRPLRRDDLMARLWPDEPEELTQNRLRVTLSSLRRVLEPEEADAGRVLVSDRQYVRLQPEALTTDILEFEANLLNAARSREDADRLRFLEAAVEKYQADFLPDFDEIWISAERARLADAYQIALRGIVKLHINHRGYEKALDVAHRAVRADPYREETHRLLIQVYTQMGRPGAALKQYQELERLLKERDGDYPIRKSNDLASRLLLKAKPGAPVSSRQATKRSGEANEETAPSRTACRIPKPVSRLIGCEDEILQVLQMLDTPETRLISLTGMGGVGKTRLALACAEQVRALGRTVFYVPLVDCADPFEILERVAGTLNVPLRRRNELWERVVRALEENDSLLVLDNVEHLLPDASATVERLLEDVSSLTCLTTSRQRLGVPGEYGFDVRPLAAPTLDDDFRQVCSSPSVRLWLDRARLSAPGVTLSQENFKDVGELCRIVEGIPLAIELAAAWAATLTPREIVNRLEARFDVLVSRNRSADRRHGSLRSTLDWSFERLAPRASRLIARLSVFRGGWTLEAAEHVCGEPQALQLLAELCDRSLLVSEATVDGMRYNALETVREYTASQLGQHDEQETLHRFRSYFLRVAQGEEVGLKGPEAAAGIHRLNRDIENLRFALYLGLKAQDRQEETLALALAMYRYWYVRGQAHEGRELLEKAMAIAPHNTVVRAKALTALGNLAYGEGDLAAALTCYRECEKIYSQRADAVGIAGTLSNLANLTRKTGNPREARALALQSLQIYRRLGDARGQSIVLGNLAMACQDLDDFEAGFEYEAEAVSQFRQLGDRHNLAIALANMSAMALRQGRTDHAVAGLSESVTLCEEMGDRRTLALVFLCTAAVSRCKGDDLAATRLFAAAQALQKLLEITPTDDNLFELNSHLRTLKEHHGEATFCREWDAGRALSYSTAIELARACLSPGS